MHVLAKRVYWGLAWACLTIGLGGIRLDAGSKIASGASIYASELLAPAAQSFGEKDGLPHLNVNELVPDSQGRIWAATQGGVAVYNGQGWTSIPLPKACHSTYARCVLPARDGALWVGTQDDGLWELRRGLWTKHDGVMGFRSNRVNSLMEMQGSEGNPIILAGTSSAGVQVLRGPRWETLPGVNHPWVWRIRRDPQQATRFWITTNRGICTWDSLGAWEARPAFPTTRDAEISDMAWTLGPDGKRLTWFSVWGQGLAREEEGRLVFEGAEAGLQSRNLTCLTAGPGPEGVETLWAASYNRGFYWRDRSGHWRETEFKQGTHSRAVYWILARPGHRPALWVGLHAAGVLAIDLEGWKNVGLPFSETHLSALSMAVLEEGGKLHYWIATMLGLVEWTGQGWRIHTRADGLPDDRVETLCATNAFGAPGLLVSTLQGLALWQNGKWRPILAPGPKWRTAIQILPTELDGHPGFWMGGTNWLVRYSQGRWTPILEGDGDFRMLVYSLKETRDPDGGSSLWVGTRGRGLMRYKAGQWSSIGSKQGFLHPSIYALQVTPRPGGHYRLWAGTLGGGLGWWDSDRPEAPWRWLGEDTNPALPSNAVVTLTPDRQGALFMSSHRGVQRLEFPPGTADQPERWNLQRFSLADGLPSQICYERSAMLDPLGRIWIGTLLGAAVFDPSDHAPQEAKAEVSLDRVWIGNREVPGDSSFALNHRQRQVAFAFSLPIYHGVQEQRFQTQLWPVESNPTAWQSLGRRELAGLAPGDYTLRIWGKDHLERVSGPLEIQIHLATPPWRRPLPLVLYGIAGLAFLLWLFRWRSRALAERNRALEALVRQAVADVERQKDKLAGLNEEKNRMMGILAHDLRNPLGVVRIYADEIAEGEIDKAEFPVIGRRIGNAVNRMLEMVTRLLDVTAIDTGKVTMDLRPLDGGSLLRALAEEFRTRAEAKHQRIVLELDPKAPKLLGDGLYLKEVLDNLVSNALKFMPSGPPERTLTLRQGPGWIEVQDQGPGFQAEEIAKAFGRYERLSARPTGGESSTGLGLSIVKGLVEAMGGSVSLISEPGQGATFRLNLPPAQIDPSHAGIP